MACPKCGAPNMLNLDILCPDCADDSAAPTDYEYNENDDTITCGKCGAVTDVTDPRTLINDGKGDDIWLWRCPVCGRVYDLEK